MASHPPWIPSAERRGEAGSRHGPGTSLPRSGNDFRKKRVPSLTLSSGAAELRVFKTMLAFLCRDGRYPGCGQGHPCPGRISSWPSVMRACRCELITLSSEVRHRLRRLLGVFVDAPVPLAPVCV